VVRKADMRSHSIQELILREAHDSAYLIHLSSTKMYKDLKTRYW
jgi:hypothetical protein